MSHTRGAAQGAPGDVRISEASHFNSTWWMVMVWLIVIVLVVSPFPWWW